MTDLPTSHPHFFCIVERYHSLFGSGPNLHFLGQFAMFYTPKIPPPSKYVVKCQNCAVKRLEVAKKLVPLQNFVWEVSDKSDI